VIPLRKHLRQYGERDAEYGAHDSDRYPQHVKDSNRYPLFSGRDIRQVHGSHDPLTNYKYMPGHGSTAAYGVAFHLHNWFNDLEATRNKYATYGHAWEPARTVKLSRIQEDLDLIVRCTNGYGNDVNPKGYPYYEHGENLESWWKTFAGTRPIYFMNDTYVQERHVLVQNMVKKDEAKYGSWYESYRNGTVLLTNKDD
jgi:hypothetical protein